MADQGRSGQAGRAVKGALVQGADGIEEAQDAPAIPGRNVQDTTAEQDEDFDDSDPDGIEDAISAAEQAIEDGQERWAESGSSRRS